MPTAPKHPSTRARRNRSTTAAVLQAAADVKPPGLPDRDDGWHPQAAAWWAELWASPMAGEFLASDVHQLLMVAALVDDYWRKPTPAKLAEIRLQGRAYGLSPLDRRRLQWAVERTEAAQDRGKRRRATPSKDPRLVLLDAAGTPPPKPAS